MKCVVYGYEAKYCFCENEKCCEMLSCAECQITNLIIPKEEKEKCCGKCNLIELNVSEETKELAKKAVEKCEKCKNEDINIWANKLENDVCNAND